MEDWLQTEWPDLKVYLTSVTEQWAAIAVHRAEGARRCCAPLVDGHRPRQRRLPASWRSREGTVAGVPARLFRISFTGELGLRDQRARGLRRGRCGRRCGRRASRFGITPYGTESMHVLRAEKGYIIVGQDTDGTVTPDDLGMDWIVGKAKKDFVGKRGLARAGIQAAGRKQLVGLLTDDPATVLEEGAQIVADPKQSRAPPMPMIGHVTSSYWSANARPLDRDGPGRGRALDGRADRLCARCRTGSSPPQIAKPVFVDPEGARLNA